MPPGYHVEECFQHVACLSRADVVSLGLSKEGSVWKAFKLFQMMDSLPPVSSAASTIGARKSPLENLQGAAKATQDPSNRHPQQSVSRFTSTTSAQTNSPLTQVVKEPASGFIPQRQTQAQYDNINRGNYMEQIYTPLPAARYAAVAVSAQHNPLLTGLWWLHPQEPATSLKDLEAAQTSNARRRDIPKGPS
ncbi:hypothetical protein VP01_801g16 [Puccinia sorghi]|uniref:Uncharacterized protein n=1 Tax=Puccinia sorghi TaxID=27349 RepID=A0A0L6UAF9_9BASI|nr:hypothetical protein VP01_801g16 [Puccinia sorghi]